MIHKKINKKAQEESTLVWFVAIFIIIFILIIFLVIAFLMADNKSLTGTSNTNQNEANVLNEPGLTSDLFSILNSQIQYNGKSESAYSAILDSFDSYFDSKSSGVSLIQKYGIDNYNDISKTTTDQMIKDGFDQGDLTKINSQNQMLALELKNKLDLYCTKYKLAIPQGVITEDGKLESSDSIKDISDSWTPIGELNISYRGVVTYIGFTELKECAGKGIIGGQTNE